MAPPPPIDDPGWLALATQANQGASATEGDLWDRKNMSFGNCADCGKRNVYIWGERPGDKYSGDMYCGDCWAFYTRKK